MFPSKLFDLELSPQLKNINNTQSSLSLSLIELSQYGVKTNTFSEFYTQKKDQQQIRQELIDEVNQEGDIIMTECNQLISQISEESSLGNSTNDSADDDIDSPKQQQQQQIYDQQQQLQQQHQQIINDLFSSIAISSNQKNKILHNQSKFTGRLKFFDEVKNYGFIVMDIDCSDIFVYSDDLAKTGLPREYLRTAKQGNIIRFQFTCMNYVGKYNQSRKAIDLEYLKPLPIVQSDYLMKMFQIQQLQQMNPLQLVQCNY